MPELPEVEAVRRVLERTLVGRTLARAEFANDPIVLDGHDPEALATAVRGARVLEAGRKGKYFWLALEGDRWLYAHLGMSGWVRNLGAASEKRLLSHGNAKLDDESGNPRFLKMLLEADDGAWIAMTDGRRLGRIWLGTEPSAERRIAALGADAYLELPSAKELAAALGKRKAPVKAVLLDQGFLAGIGNWVADEVLYHAGIDPRRAAASLKHAEVVRLRNSIESVLETAVEAEADERSYPAGWLFPIRWGGSRGKTILDGNEVRRETIGGRTTAWVPAKQK